MSLNLLCFILLGEYPEASKRKQIRMCIFMTPMHIPNTEENNYKSNGQTVQSFTRTKKINKVSANVHKAIRSPSWLKF